MKLHQLKRSSGFKNKAKQRGRWNGTGTGNYSWKGLKWQKARSWHSMKAFFEWWQTSIIQRLPKAKGFKRPFKLVKDIVVINLGTFDQDKRITDAMDMTKAVLKTLWYIKHEHDTVKLLGDGDYSKHLVFTGVELFSKSAKEKIDTPSSVKTGKVKVKSIKSQKVDKEAIKAAKPKKASKAVKKEVVVKKAVVKKKVVKRESE